jgi:hypothetical protein
MRLTATAVVGGLVIVAASAEMRAQSAPYVPKQSDRPSPVEGDEPGFVSLFDGQTLAGWEGDPTYWRVENGVLVGEITPATVVKSNTFIIWRGGRPKDFELKLDYRITPTGNSGINYRSVSASRCAATSSTSTARAATSATTTRRRAGSSWPSAAR